MAARDAATPRWIEGADHCYGLTLSLLLPATTRRDFELLMRQAFRDRCREVVRGERSLWSLLLGEIVPDLLHAAWIENLAAVSAFDRRRRLIWTGVIVATLGLAFAADGIGRWYWNHFNPNHRWYVAQLAQEQARQAPVRDFVAYLDDRPTATERVAAVWLRAYLGSWTQTDDDRAAQAVKAREQAARVRALARLPMDVTTRMALMEACDPDAGCDLAALQAQVTREEPGNGYALLARLRDIGRGGNDNAVQAAMVQLANASRIEGHEAAWMHTLLHLRDQYPGADAAFDESLYRVLSWQARFQPGFAMAASRCGPGQVTADAAWAATCASLAGRFAASGNSYGEAMAARMRVALAADPAARSAAQVQWQQARQLIVRPYHLLSLESNGTDESRQGDALDPDGRRWQAAWRNASTESAARAEWLRTTPARWQSAGMTGR